MTVTREQVIAAVRPGITLGSLFEEFGLAEGDVYGRSRVLLVLTDLKSEGHLTITAPSKETTES